MASPPVWHADVIARDGSLLHVRGIRPADADALQALHAGQSDSSRVFRFFAPKGPFTEEELRHFTEVDGVERVALVVTELGVDAPLLAVARYDRFDDEAEVAFYVADTQHGRGLGSLLLDHLAAIGRRNGISRFVADVLPTNGRMLAVFKDAGYSISAQMEDGVVGVSFALESTAHTREVAEARERYSEARSMIPVLEPTTVIRVPGDTVPAGGEGVLAVVEGAVDRVPAALGELGRAGVRAAVVTAGSGVADGEWHRAVAEAARTGGMRLVGPGSFGIVTASGINATGEPRLRGGGRLAVFAQSGESARALARDLVEADEPVALFVAAGHRLDVSGNDVMQFLTGRPGIGAVAVCLDSIGNPRKFARVARRLAAEVPLICHIASGTGQEAPPGHPVRTSPLPRSVLTAMLREAGVVEAEARADLVPLARLAMTGDLADVPAARPLLPDPEAIRPGEARALLLAAPDGPLAPAELERLLSLYGIGAPSVPVEAREDRLYGPVISLGAGAISMLPLGEGSAEELLRQAGGDPASAEPVRRIARLMEDHPRLTQLRVAPDGNEATVGEAARPRRARGVWAEPAFAREED